MDFINITLSTLQEGGAKKYKALLTNIQKTNTTKYLFETVCTVNDIAINFKYFLGNTSK